MFFLNDVVIRDSNPVPPVSFTKHPSLSSVEQQNELDSGEPLLPPRSHDTLSKPIACPSTPTDFSSSMGYGSFSTSPFVVVGEVEVEVEADAMIDGAEEAVLLGESTLKRELSLSMLGCHEGVYSPEYFPSPEERPATPLPPLETEQGVDHACALPCVTPEPVQAAPVPVQEAVLPSRTADAQSPEHEVCIPSRAGHLILTFNPILNTFLCSECRGSSSCTARARPETV